MLVGSALLLLGFENPLAVWKLGMVEGLVRVAFLPLGVGALLLGVTFLLDRWTLVGVAFLLLGVAALLGGVVAGAVAVRCGHRSMLAAPSGAAAVDPRTISWGRTTTWVRAGRREPSPPLRAVRTAARAREPTAWRTVVSGGLVSEAQKTSSYPTTEMSRATLSPCERTPSRAPAAITSEPQTMAVTPRSTRSRAAS